MDVSKNSGTPKSSIFIGFSIIFTIHFGGNTPIFGSTPTYFPYDPSEASPPFFAAKASSGGGGFGWKTCYRVEGAGWRATLPENFTMTIAGKWPTMNESMYKSYWKNGGIFPFF